jgi:hypothetical protein
VLPPVSLSNLSLYLFLLSRIRLIYWGVYYLFCQNNVSHEMLHHAEPLSPSSPRRVRCLGKLRVITRNPRRPLLRLLPLWLAWSMLIGSLPQFHRRRPSSSPCLGRRSWAPESSLKVTVLTLPILSPVLHAGVFLGPPRTPPPPFGCLTLFPAILIPP